MKHIKKASLLLLAVIVFTYTSFAISTSNIKKPNQLIGKSQEVELINAKGKPLAQQRLTPLAVVVVLAIVLVSTSPAYTSHGDAPQEPQNTGVSNETLQKVAIHNLD